jgi:predicted RNA-binding Zn-ribbon protein involved in translation (DUF1610 family)
MAEFITLSCPSCGGKLQVSEDLDQFACAHCGTEHLSSDLEIQCLWPLWWLT